MIAISYIMNQDLVDSKNQSMDFLPPKSQNQSKRISYDMGTMVSARKIVFSSAIVPFSLDTRSGEWEMKNELLGKDELSLYDYVKLRNIVLDIFKLFKYLKRTDDKISIPKITADYRVRYEQFVPVKNSVVENCVLKNMMLETKLEIKRRKLLSKITLALRKLNELEMQVFDLTFYKCMDEEEIIKIVSYNKDKVRDIKKSACIKFISALGLDDRCFK